MPACGYKFYLLVFNSIFLTAQSGQSEIHCKIKETLLIRDLKPALNENIGSEKLLLY